LQEVINLETAVKKLYEAMFLVDTALAASDWDGINKTIKKMFKKVDADIVSLRKWDERPLAYPVNGKVRGTYLLCYFQADGDKIQTIERDVRLSETIMRVLILKADHMTQADVDKETPVGKAERKKQEAIEAAKIRAEKAISQAEPEVAETEVTEPEVTEPKVTEPEVAEPQQAEEEQTEKPEEDVAVDAVECKATEEDQGQDADSTDQQESEEDQIENTDDDTKE